MGGEWWVVGGELCLVGDEWWVVGGELCLVGGEWLRIKKDFFN